MEGNEIAGLVSQGLSFLKEAAIATGAAGAGALGAVEAAKYALPRLVGGREDKTASLVGFWGPILAKLAGASIGWPAVIVAALASRYAAKVAHDAVLRPMVDPFVKRTISEAMSPIVSVENRVLDSMKQDAEKGKE